MSTITTALLKSNQPSPLSGILSNSHIQQETRIKDLVKETDENVVRLCADPKRRRKFVIKIILYF